jgi:hypothetical protein
MRDLSMRRTALGVAAGPALTACNYRGSPFATDEYSRELAFLRFVDSLVFVREPSANGSVESFIHPLRMISSGCAAFTIELPASIESSPLCGSGRPGVLC